MTTINFSNGNSLEISDHADGQFAVYVKDDFGHVLDRLMVDADSLPAIAESFVIAHGEIADRAMVQEGVDRAVNPISFSENSPAIVAGGMTYSEIEAAFDLVADPSDWKAPIDMTIPSIWFTQVAAAVEFFTATKLVVKSTINGYNGVKVHVMAVGYREGPAGP